MVGPPVAGVIIEVWSLSASLFVIAGCYAMSIICVVKIGRTAQAVKATSGSVFRNFADRISYIKNNQGCSRQSSLPVTLAGLEYRTNK